MSLKCFCDVCGAEIADEDQGRVLRQLGKVMVEIMVRYENGWNAGHVCPPCVVRVVNEGERASKNQSYVHTSVPPGPKEPPVPPGRRQVA